jgi:hypothetical protein
MATNSVSADNSTAFAIIVLDSTAPHGAGLVARHRRSHRWALDITRTLLRNSARSSHCRSGARATVVIMPWITPVFRSELQVHPTE